MTTYLTTIECKQHNTNNVIQLDVVLNKKYKYSQNEIIEFHFTDSEYKNLFSSYYIKTLLKNNANELLLGLSLPENYQLTRQQLQHIFGELYLNFINDYLTIEKMAEDFNIDQNLLGEIFEVYKQSKSDYPRG